MGESSKEGCERATESNLSRVWRVGDRGLGNREVVFSWLRSHRRAGESTAWC